MKINLIMTVVAAMVAGETFSGTFFEESFRNYSDKAPGVTSEGFDVINDPIHARHAYVRAVVEKDSPVFLKDIALPADGKFDLLFTYAGGETNSALEVVFKLPNGKTAVLPVAGKCSTKEFILKAAGGKLEVFNETKRVFAKTGELAVPAAQSVNFTVKAGGAVNFSDVVLRTPEPLPDYSALRQFAASSSLNRTLGAGAKVSDGSEIAANGKSISFIPGATGVVGKVTIVYADEQKKVFPITVGDQTYRSPVSS